MCFSRHAGHGRRRDIAARYLCLSMRVADPLAGDWVGTWRDPLRYVVLVGASAMSHPEADATARELDLPFAGLSQHEAAAMRAFDDEVISFARSGAEWDRMHASIEHAVTQRWFAPASSRRRSARHHPTRPTTGSGGYTGPAPVTMRARRCARCACRSSRSGVSTTRQHRPAPNAGRMERYPPDSRARTGRSACSQVATTRSCRWRGGIPRLSRPFAGTFPATSI